MSEQNKLLAVQALQQARRAFHEGDHIQARRLAMRAARLDSTLEDAWLILAALSTPQVSLVYLKRALQSNPQSKRARQGIHWAIRRQRSIQTKIPLSAINQKIPAQTQKILTKKGEDLLRSTQCSRGWSTKKQPGWGTIVASGIIVFIVLCLGAAFWLVLSSNEIVKANQLSAPRPAGAFIKPTLTSTNTPTITVTETPTSTPTPPPTETPTTTFTPLPSPTQQPPPLETPAPVIDLPEQIPSQDHWIDVNLTQQMVYAYEGDRLINSFVVSTGTWQHPTVTGDYRIYAKYRYTDMAGPGYYLPNVPYTMYFYKGYALHGTYWHNNFGTPMSHGCINLSITDAAWLYEWSAVGTLVRIHY